MPEKTEKLSMRQALVKAAAGASGALAEAVARFDSWQNGVTGFGTTRDKSTYGSFQPFLRVNDVELSSLYHGFDVAARIVDIVPQEMYREGFVVDTGDKDINTPLAEKLDDLNVNAKFADAERWARLYGGSAILIGADDGQDVSLPLKPERVRDIKYLYVIERRVLWPVSYYTDAGNPKLGEPETYMVTPMISGGGTGNATVIVHESRLIIFRGAKTGAFEKLALAGWDISVLQRPYETIRQFDTAWKAVETLLTDGNQAVFKMSGLAEMIAAGQDIALRKRLTTMEMCRSVMRALVVDAESAESYERTTVSFDGIANVLDKFMLRLSSAAETPATILMGQSPAGLSATGDADFRWFFDRIKSKQTTDATPKIRRLSHLWLMSKASPIRGKEMPKTITVNWPALWTETPAAEAARRYAIAQTDCLYVDSQVYLPEEIALSRSRPEGFNDDVIQISDAARKARETLLTSDVKKLATDTLAAPAPTPTGTAPPPTGTPKAKALPAAAPAAAAPPGQKLDESSVTRDENGRFGTGDGSAKALAGPLAEKVQSEGGFTMRPDAPAGARVPTTGIMVSRAPEENHGHVVEVEKMANADPPPTASELKAAVAAETEKWLDKALPAAKMLGEDHYLGGWAEKNPDGSVKAIHFDISQRFDSTDKDKAVAAGRERNQVAVWHIEKGEEIHTGGTGR